MHHQSTATPERPWVLKTLTAFLLLLPAYASNAQTSPPAVANAPADPNAAQGGSDQVVKLQPFNVTGSYASSLAIAAAAKEAATTITEVLVAEDIGKLPDVSIADSLTRLTGVAAERVNGRSQEIDIRGFTGDFTTGLLNGREQATTAENRTIEFDQYPSDLLDSVTVHKTATASLTNQGLAATIDMHTVQPLTKGKRIVSASAYYQWTQYHQLTPGAKAKGNRVNLSYVDQFLNDTLGVAVGFSHSDTPWEGKQFQAWGYPTDSAGNFALGGTKSYVRTSELKRNSLMGVLEYRPNDSIHSTIDLFTSSFEEKQLLRGMEIPLAFWSSAQLQPGYTVKNGLITQSTLTNVQPVVRNDVFKRNDSPFSIGWNLVLGETSSWPVLFDAGYSRVTRTDENLETYSGLGFRQTSDHPDTMTVTLIPGEIPVIKSTLDYADGSVLKLSDPQGWGPASLKGGGMYGYLKYFQSKDELGEVRASTKHKMDSFLDTLELGADYTDRFKRDGENPSGFLQSPTGASTFALPPKIGTTDMSFLGLGNIYAYDPLAAYAAGVWEFVPNWGSYASIVAVKFQVHEKITQPYAQFDINSHLGSVKVTGDVGVRAIRVDQESTGFSANGNTLNPVNGGAKYTDWAPDLNLNFRTGASTYIRFSLARQLARPRMFDMRASRTWTYDPSLANSTDLSRSPWSGNGGNPKLRPWRSNSIDLSLEHYFDNDKGYVSLAAFDKKLLTYIYTQNSLADFSSYPVQGPQPALHQGIISEPVNGQGGYIRGLEGTIQLPFEVASRWARGFGVKLDGAYTDSSIQPWGPGNGNSPVAGFSRKVGNITFYYEQSGFSARISERYRSANREYITTFGPPNRAGDVSPGSGFTLAQPEKIVDAQISYSLQSGRAKGLTIYLQAYNLNNEPLVTYQNGDPRQVMNYQKYGASYSFGASFKF